LTENDTSCLAKLLNPVSTEAFYETYFEQALLHISRTGEKNSYGHLFHLSNLDQCLSRMVNHNSVSVVKSKEDKRIRQPIRPNTRNPMVTFYDAFYQGHTIIVNGIQQHLDSAETLTHDLGHDLGCRVHINMYVTPPNATGFTSHWDGHDVLILQLAGKKDWAFFEGGPDLPPINERDEVTYEVDDEPVGDPFQEIVLEPGDLLYVPCGLIHRASSLEETTIHWTVGLHPHTMEDLLHAVLKGWARKSRALRQALPVGCMKGEGDLVALEGKIRSMLVDAAQEVHLKTCLHDLSSPWRSTRSCGDGHFEQLGMVDHMTLDTVVEKRHGDHLHLTPGLDACLLQAPGFRFQPPGNAYQSLSYMSRHDTFTARGVQGWLSEEENLLLIRHLVQNGFLRIVSLEAGEDNTDHGKQPPLQPHQNETRGSS